MSTQLPLRACGLALALAISTGAVAQDKGVGPISVQKDVIDVAGSGHERTFPCNGRKVVVQGSGHVLTFTGVCSSVELYGVNNKLTVQVAPNGSLSITGADHQVKWQSTGEPTQDFSGANNKIVKVPLKP